MTDTPEKHIVIERGFDPRQAQTLERKYVCAQCYSALKYKIEDITARPWRCHVFCAGETFGESCGDIEDVGRVTVFFAQQEGRKRVRQYELLLERDLALSGDADILALLEKRWQAKGDYKRRFDEWFDAGKGE